MSNSTHPQTLLIVDDDSAVRLSAHYLLTRHGYHIVEAESPEQALALIQEQSIDLLLMDMNYTLDTTSGQEGLTLLNRIKEGYPDLPVVVMTAWSSVDLAVKSLQSGAQDFVEKPWDNQRLLQIIHQQLALGDLQRKNQHLRQYQQEALTLDSAFIAQSPAMKDLLEKIARVAHTDANILLTGENGTGKSCLASFIHQHSKRQNESLIAVNMGAIPETLFESELFGHSRGAFTDAKTSRDGRFALAEGGTLFLDEIGTIPFAQQAKLLRVLESGEYERVGESKTRHANARIISASNANFDELIEQRTFRQDLFYRLNTITLHVPALRERTEDIVPLANHFLQRFSQNYGYTQPQLTADAEQCLLSHHWPGNIRELSHTMERVLLFNSDPVIRASDIDLPKNHLGTSKIHPASVVTQLDKTSFSSPDPSPATQQSEAMTEPSFCTLEESEVQHIREALNRVQGNSADAANLLGISLSALYRRMEKYELKSR